MTETDQAEMPATDAIPETEIADSSPVEETPEVTPELEGDDTTPEPEAKKPHWSQKRIDELTRNWRQEQREKQQLLEMLQQQKPVEAARTVEIKLPTLEEHGYDEAKYQAALLEYADRRAEAVVERRLTEAEQKRTEQTRLESFVTRQREFAKTTPDFEDKVLRDPTLPITETMRDVIVDSPTGPEMAYYLASNREVAEQISTLPPHLAALEMGRIEGRLSAQKEAAKRPAPVISQAPPPTPRVEAADATVDTDPDKLSDADWVKWREKQIRAEHARKFIKR